MERKAVVVCLAMGFLSLLSAGLALAAEMTKIQASGLIRTKDDICLYRSSPASLLGMLSTLSYMFAHIGIHAASGCMCCQRPHNHSNLRWTIGLIFYVVSWVTFVPATLLLLHGALLNDQGWNEVGATGDYLVSYCDVAGDGIFSSGGALVLLSNLLSIVFYLVLRPIKGVLPVGDHQMPPPHDEFGGGGGHIAIGQPQLPLPAPVVALPPVVVH